ncbi:hypothetical protein E0Z06_08760 [Rheinheimera sp. D18]|uniref:outer membrane beta-barrel protein n=1 Tax=Rheinheimera sp. D18 TaxID=2545632 RepID=UPI00104A339A|nr:outer membrane beta-barrel protein [Rheinheimera sp. D18]QBL09593.1 hypothetical protein E0Z06_08760 [Rheinheimera sp. D18]
MDMGTIMVVPKYRISTLSLLITFGLVSASATAGDWQLKPSLLLDTYAYQLKKESNDAWDKGAAAVLTPDIALLYDSKNLVSIFGWQQKNIFYDDKQRTDKSLDYINFDTRLSAWDKRVVWSVSANKDYRVRNSQRGIFADEITGYADLSKTQNLRTSLLLRSAPHKEIQSSLSLTASQVNSKAPENDDVLGNFDNELYAASFSLGKRQRTNEFYWLINSAYSQSVRDIGTSLTSKNADVIVGVPMFHNLAWVNRARFETNDIATNYTNEFRSVGTGLEYRFGKVSYINATYNRYSQQQLEETNDNYWALDMLIAPTRRSSIQVILDRRYYGRSVEVSGSYRLQHLSAKLSYNERVTVNNGLDRQFTDLGLFVCSGASSSITGCFLPPTANYQLAPGEVLQNFVRTDVEITENVVLRKGGSFNLAYDKDRLALSLNIVRSEDEYVESSRLNKTKAVSFNGKWRLSPLITFSAAVNVYELEYSLEQRTDKNIQLTAGTEVKLNDHSDVSLNVRRVKRSSNQTQFDLQENRVWLSYDYRF